MKIVNKKLWTYYNNKIKDHLVFGFKIKRYSDIILQSIIGLLILSVLTTIYSFYVGLEDDFILPSSLLQILIAGYLLTSIQLSIKFKKDVLIHSIKNKTIKSLDQDKIPDLFELVREICQVLNVNANKVSVSKKISFKYFPSISTVNNNIYLILPTNFFILWKTHNGFAKALIIHEFAHIKQIDHVTWFHSDIMGSLLYTSLVPIGLYLEMLNLQTIFYTADHLLVWVLVIMQFILTATIQWFSSNWKNSRTQSEELADMLAIVFGLGDDLIRGLKEFALDSEDVRTPKIHPKIIDRIQQIKYNINLYG